MQSEVNQWEAAKALTVAGADIYHPSAETYWKGVLSHNLAENATYREAAIIGKEFRKFSDTLKNLKKKSRVAFVLNNDALSGLKWFPISQNLSYNDIFRWIFDACYRLNVECDILSSEDTCFSDYDLLIVPALYSASEEVLRRLDSYVKNGGHMLITFKSGFSDENLKVYSDNQPHLLTECTGMTYDRFTIPANVSLTGTTLGSLAENATVSEWIELLEPSTASVWCNYQHPHYSEYSAVTHNKYGKGSCTYLGCYFDSTFLETVLRRLFTEIEIELPSFSFPVILKQGINEKGELIKYYFNYSDNTETITYTGNDGKLLFTDMPIHSGNDLKIEGWDLQIVVTKNE